jgi:aspartate kinase
MKVELIQNSAISFSVCVDNMYNNLEKLLQSLKAKFRVECTENVSLYTIRHYNTETLHQLENQKKVLLKQIAQETVQIITK